MKIQVTVNINLEKIELLDGFIINQINNDDLGEIIYDIYSADELIETIGNKFKEEEMYGNGDVKYCLVN